MAKTAKKFQINGKEVARGQNEVIRLNVARLPSGTVISLRILVYRSKLPGPTALIMGGVHGDEINGVEIVRRAIKSKMFEQLKVGSVIAIPLLNVYGFINFSRDASEGKDVNRSFPGNAKGSLASRVAHTVTKNILPLIDFGLDFHTGGSSRYNFPQVRYTKGDTAAKEIAHAFAAPYLISKTNTTNTLRKQAHSMGKPIVVYEGGESLRFDGFAIARALAGLQRVLHRKGMLDAAPKPTSQPITFQKTTWVRADRSGIFEWLQESGCKVSIGEKLGIIRDPYGESEVYVKASRTGYIIGHNNAPVVSQGDALFHIGYQL
ncbi:MAG TPA: succinylglutamate desuccinylase/aspartoacylase family protein [Phaeodactylibacter sp.]|nr:succinylglutamate desuccinylase/aspartoacylase family protein [Phaeodactylibacter sp.]